ncbi:MAG: hypothetical protein PHV07_04280, partial [Oscillospiraceae bacterium]|nr:hypothetical protein [Oscillospiraceae bacterium]
MPQIRRQEFVVTQEEHDMHSEKVLLKNEFLYVEQEDGKLKLKHGDGFTPLSALNYSIDIGAAELATHTAISIKEDIDSIHENIIDLEQSATESATSAGISEVNSKASETAASNSADTAANNILNGV